LGTIFELKEYSNQVEICPENATACISDPGKHPVDRVIG